MGNREPEKRQEAIIYAIVWAAVFIIVPATGFFSSLTVEGMSFSPRDLLAVWLRIIPFFILFLLHNGLAAPLLVERRKNGSYAGLVTLLLILFGTYIWVSRRGPDGAVANMPPDDKMHYGLPMAPEVMRFMMGLLVLGVNLGVKYYLKSVRSERRMRELKAENLGRQLETLRYQINPHFFMNTLNNIHALVDIDPERAKEGIEEFSKLMRFVLYEGDRSMIPLSQEVEFLRHYVSLMRMRYPVTVRIDLELPEGEVAGEVPPLVFASFVENAFKHGVSYENPSFIRMSVAVQDGKTVFRCTNSVHSAERTEGKGIGLENVRRRLELLYGSGYTLDIDRNDAVFDVRLALPSKAGRKEGSV